MSKAEQEDQQTRHLNANTSYELSRPSHPTSFKITGLLPDGKRLTRPLDVVVAYDEEVIVSEPRFHIHATGSTIAKAIAEFKRILAEELDDLTANAEELGPSLQAELQYLRRLIRAA